MQNVIFLIHLLITLVLACVVLLQRSEGAGLGPGGGGGSTGARPPVTALGKLTWALGIGLCTTSLILTVIATSNSTGGSVLERFGGAPAADQTGGLDPEGDLLPNLGPDEPLVPPVE